MPNWQNPENDQLGLEWWEINYEQQLSNISEKIKDLDGDENKEALQKLLTEEFINNLDSFLKDNPELRTQLQNTLITALDPFRDKPEDTYKNDKTYNSLVKLAEKIWLKKNTDWTWSVESQETWNSAIEKPAAIQFEWTSELTSIKGEGDAWTEGKGLYNWLTRNAPKEGETLDEDKDLYKTIETIKSQSSRVSDLLSDKHLKDDPDLNNIIKWLKFAQTAIDYPTEDNVRNLQKFISKNLEGQDKTVFDGASKGPEFDWKFWKGTLKWCNIILKKIDDEYISKMEEYLKALNDKENQDKVDKVKPKTNKTIKKWEAIEAKDLVDDLEEGVEVAFVDGDEEKKLGNVWPQEVKLIVTCNGKTKEITVNVTVAENTSDTPGIIWTPDNSNSTIEQPAPSDTTPLTMEDWKTYLVMRNSWTLAMNSGLNWSTFYCINEHTGNKPGNGEQWGTAEQPWNSNDYYCYMDLKGKPGVYYKVKVDKYWNICPIATQYSKNVKWLQSEVLLRRNKSCINYLSNKLWGYWTIDWSTYHQDYRVVSHGKSLTIEPMTIDWSWISDDLSTCLRLLNLTNYLRSWEDNLDWPDPDLKLDGNQLLVKTNMPEKKDRWKPIALGNYWLDWVDKNVLKRFIKYNNGERRRDDWNHKKPNTEYKKI